MNRVAFVAYLFPPIGGGGTPRSVKFVKYLPHFGWRPVVFTVEQSRVAGRWEFQADKSQIGELDAASYDLVRVPENCRGLSRLRGHRLFSLAWASAYPWLWEEQLGWARDVEESIVEAGRRQRFDAIYATAFPYSSILAASRASRRLGVPWVADLRDLWTTDTLKAYPSRLHYAWESRLERRLLRQADAVVANTPLSRERLRGHLGADVAARIVVIQNGFDPDEFPAASARRSPALGEHIVVLHAGTLHDPNVKSSRLFRYRPISIDDEARSPVPLARGLSVLWQRSPCVAAQVRIRLVGYTPAAARECVTSLGVAGQFSFEGVVPRTEALAAQRDADALLIAQLAFGEADHLVPYVPGKVYDYLATGAPILAPIARGDLHDLLSEAPQAYLSDYRDPERIAASLDRLVADLRSGNVLTCDPGWIRQFSRVELTHRLSDLLGAIARRGSPVGSLIG